MKVSAVLAFVVWSSADTAIAQNATANSYCSSSLPCDAGYFCELPLVGANGTSADEDGYCTTCPKYDNLDPMDCLHVQSLEGESEEVNVTPSDLQPSSSNNKGKKQNILRYVAHKSYTPRKRLCLKLF
jgi:hypothetical protein